MNTNIPSIVIASAILSCAASLHGAQGPYEPQWQSLARHAVPRWYEDAKFGIYFHWGPYSVAAFGSEWYSRNMYQNGPENKFHVEKYGPLDKFGYKDFIPLFTAEKFNADEWAELFEKAGARFAGPVAEHAEGFALWDSKVNPWNAAKMAPKQDLVGKLETAIRKRNLKFITTFHHQWLWGWYSTTMTNADVFDPHFYSFYGQPLPTNAFDFANPVPKPTAEFCQTWHDKVIEVIDAYHPDLIYFDNRTTIIDEPTRLKFLAYFYNQAQKKGREVVMTYKNEDFAKGSGVVDLECGRMADITPFKWQTDDDMDWNSWAYLESPNYKPATRLIHQLVDIVSKNGNLLLDIGPRPDGTIPEPVKERLLQIGAWLKTNGEAIYGTRPFTVYGEGPTKIKEVHFGEQGLKAYTAADFRFTTEGRILYATALVWPPDGRLLIKTLASSNPAAPGKIRHVELLGFKGKVDWTQTGEGLSVRLPSQKTSDHAWVFKISGVL